MSSGIQMIVGLGNPGKNYAQTRHNAGAWFVEAIAADANVHLRHEPKFHGLYSTLHTEENGCHLLIPTTFMNLSGKSVRACLNYFKLLPEQLLIVYDEIDLPVGKIKLKFDGGDGGHNGVKDITHQLNTRQFYRLRIGVGHPGHSKHVIDYVLNPPTMLQRETINFAIHEAKQILPLLFTGDVDKAMQKLHTASDKLKN